MITAPDTQADDLIATGRRFENMFLRVREKMIGIHPMTQLLEEDKFKSNVAAELGLKGSEVQFILRVGYLDSYPDPVSLRRPLNKRFTGNS
ncbi:MAG: hypothetical protein HBSAPP04_14350 [Ignavibacteriaceae bacterium]|nr:MAG: hypothetical protein HBSAPP04_14350 [Ignavibacteriaceae bacterium]